MPNQPLDRAHYPVGHTIRPLLRLGWCGFFSRGCVLGGVFVLIVLRDFGYISRFGGDLLSHVLRRSTIGATALNGRVRDGIGCFACAMTTKPRNIPLSSALLGGVRSWAVSRLHGAVRRTSDYPSPVHLPVYAFDPAAFAALSRAWLFLDQIKPIEQLVPVN